MFEGKTLWQIVNMGGFTMYVLLFCSVISIGVILGRLFTYAAKSKINKIEFMGKIRAEIERGNINGAVKLCEQGAHRGTPIASVVLAGLKKHGHEEKMIT